MLPTHILKKYFPNAQDWLLGGALLVILLWLVVLPVEVHQALTRQAFLGASSLVWLVRSTYILGFGISMSLISPWTNSSLSLSDLRLAIVLGGLLIASPVYFGLGALLSAKRGRILGILLLVIMVIFDCLVTLALRISD